MSASLTAGSISPYMHSTITINTSIVIDYYVLRKATHITQSVSALPGEKTTKYCIFI